MPRSIRKYGSVSPNGMPCRASSTDIQSSCGSANRTPITIDNATTERLRIRAETSSLNSRFATRRGSRSERTDRPHRKEVGEREERRRRQTPRRAAAPGPSRAPTRVASPRGRRTTGSPRTTPTGRDRPGARSRSRRCPATSQRRDIMSGRRRPARAASPSISRGSRRGAPACAPRSACTSTGCVFDARMSPQPSPNSTRTPSTSITSCVALEVRDRARRRGRTSISSGQSTRISGVETNFGTSASSSSHASCPTSATMRSRRAAPYSASSWP